MPSYGGRRKILKIYALIRGGVLGRRIALDPRVRGDVFGGGCGRVEK